MVEQYKNHTTKTIENIEHLASHLGVAVMLAAAVAGMFDNASRESHHLIASLQPAYALAGQAPGFEDTDQLQLRRSGKEEIRHTTVSYGAAMRSHAIAGTV